MSPLIHFIVNTVMISNAHCSTDDIGSLHIDSSLDGAGGG